MHKCFLKSYNNSYHLHCSLLWDSGFLRNNWKMLAFLSIQMDQKLLSFFMSALCPVILWSCSFLLWLAISSLQWRWLTVALLLSWSSFVNSCLYQGLKYLSFGKGINFRKCSLFVSDDITWTINSIGMKNQWISMLFSSNSLQIYKIN